jgi:hypothetical protein
MKRGNAVFPRRWFLFLLSVFLVTPQVRAASQDKVAELQSNFDRETSSVRKAKDFVKLGDAQFAEARAASRSRDFPSVGLIMEKYRDNARLAFAALRKEHPNAEKQMGGYKQLQMHIDSALREIDETLIVAPQEFKPPLVLVREDLSNLDDQLLRMLFPNRPKPKGTPDDPPAKPPDTALQKPLDAPAASPENRL